MACPDDNALGQLADGALAGPARAAVEAHLDGCAACAEVVAELAWQIMPARSAPARFRLIRRLGDDGDRWLAIDRTSTDCATVELAFAPRAGTELAAARAAIAVTHPNLRRVIDADVHADGIYTATELVPGPTARAWSADAPRSRADVIAVWRAAIAGVAALHRAGVVHGGPTADAVIVGAGGRIVIGGAGLDPPPGSGHIAPERLHGAPASRAADQFALCVAGWDLLAGRRPFTGATVGALAVQMLTPPASPPAADRADRAVYAVLARGLAADPGRRWPDLDALAAALDRPPRARRGIVVAIAIATAAAAAVTAGILAAT